MSKPRKQLLCDALTTRSHLTTVHVLVQVQDFILHPLAMVAEWRRNELWVSRIVSRGERCDGIREMGWCGRSGRIRELGMLTNPAVEMIISKLSGVSQCL